MAVPSEQISTRWIEGAVRECRRCGAQIKNLARDVGEVRSVYPGPRRDILCMECHLAGPEAPPKRIRDPELLRRFRLECAGEPCWACELRPGIHVHHKIFRSQSGDDAIENLSWLCGPCHDEAHNIRSVWYS